MITIHLSTKLKNEANKYLLEILTYLLATKQINNTEKLSKLIDFWLINISDENLVSLLNNCKELIARYNTADEDVLFNYVKLSQNLDFYYKLFGVQNNSELAVTISRKITQLFKKYKVLDMFNHIEKENFDDVDELVLKMQTQLQELSMDNEEIQESFINLQDYEQLVQTLQQSFRIACLIPEIDNILMGFMPANLYLFGGALGGGKSAMLMNLAIGLATSVKLVEEALVNYIQNITGKSLKPIIVYISLENNRIQIASRYYSILYNTLPFQSSPEIVKPTPLSVLHNKVGINNIAIFDFADKLIHPSAVKRILENIMASGFYPVAVIIDYLDEFYIEEKLELRHKIGLSAKLLRAYANQFNTIMISATQLNRKGIEGELSIATLSESIEHAKRTDVLTLIRTVNVSKQVLINNLLIDEEFEKQGEYPAMFVKIVKNRTGLLTGRILIQSTSSKLGFKSLVYCKDWDVSLNKMYNLLPDYLKYYLSQPNIVYKNAQTNSILHMTKPDDLEPDELFHYIINQNFQSDNKGILEKLQELQ